MSTQMSNRRLYIQSWKQPVIMLSMCLRPWKLCPLLGQTIIHNLRTETTGASYIKVYAVAGRPCLGEADNPRESSQGHFMSIDEA